MGDYKEAIFIVKTSDGSWDVKSSLDINDTSKDNAELFNKNDYISAEKTAGKEEIGDGLFDMEKYGYEDVLLIKELDRCFTEEELKELDYSMQEISQFEGKTKKEVMVLIAAKRTQTFNTEQKISEKPNTR